MVVFSIIMVSSDKKGGAAPSAGYSAPKLTAVRVGLMHSKMLPLTKLLALSVRMFVKPFFNFTKRMMVQNQPKMKKPPWLLERMG
jgi:hypothetical protein